MIAVNLKDSALLFDTISTCESGVRETFLENVGCDSIEITQIQQRNDKFTILEPALPCWVRSGEQKKIVLRFGSKNVGASSDKILIYATIGGSATLSLPLELSAYSISEPAAILLSTNKITLDTISPCFKLDTTIFLFNPMRCDSLQIDSIVLHSSNNFSVVASSNTIAPNDSINIHLIFTPDYQTIERDSLFITMSSPHSKIDTVITFTALVEGTTRSLIISDYNINFDTLSICDTKDTIVTLYNSGCDTLMISKADFSGLGFYSSASLPITIPPYTIKDLQINASPDTTTAKRINNSMLTLSSNSIASPNSISLRSQIRYPSMVTMCLVPKQKLFEVGGLGHVDIKTNSTSITGLKTLDLAMHYNRDMLRFNQALSINTITTTDSLLFHIVGNPEIVISSDSSLGDLTFDVFLTKDTLTTFVVDSLQLNPGDLQYQNCSFAYLPTVASEIYGLDFGCGGRMILQYLLSHTSSIHNIIISPVPTFDNLQLSLYSEQIQNARLIITSAVGTPMMSSENVLSIGANHISLETRSLPSGTYQLQLLTKDASYWQSFVKLK